MPPSNRFPILRLPLLPLELIIKFMTLSDICSLAVSSDEIQKYLRKLPLKLQKLFLSQDNIDTFRVDFVPENQIGDGIHSYLESISPEKWHFFDLDERKKISYEHENRKLLQICEQTEYSLVPKETLFLIYKRLSECFISQEVTVQFSKVPKEVVLGISTKFKKIGHLYLGHPSSKLTSDELSSLLENCSTESFALNWSVEEDVKYHNSLRYQEMTLWTAPWLTIDCLLNMDCVSLKARDILLTMDDVKKFVEKWLAGGLENLQMADLTHRSWRFRWLPLLDGFEKTLLNHRDAHFVKSDIGVWENVWEIRRSDGRRAGVYAGFRFIFKVL